MSEQVRFMKNNCITTIYRSFVTLFTSGAIAWVTVVWATDASDWSEDTRSAMRLIAGTNKPGVPLTAGIEIRLQPGWHTYWRSPGDSGIPPRFDFSGSSNLKTAEVLYPVPQLRKDEGGQSLGYEADVIFPVKVTPIEIGKPIGLKVMLAYAVCEKLCIPAIGHAELHLDIGESAQELVLQAALARVPKPVSPAEIGLSVRRINHPKPSITVDLRAPAHKRIQLFVEGPTPEWALPIPKKETAASADHQQFNFELDGLPPGVDPKDPLELTFTIVEGNGGVEVKTHLD
jgi:DsbC/DsbD-like thiol-disulfide interchange protein